MWKEFLHNLSIMSRHHVFSKIMTTAAILIAAIIIIKIVDALLTRWQKKIITKLKKVMPADVSSLETKITIIRRLINAAVYFVALIIFLLQFESVRHLGAGFFASAGIAGIVIGLAAQNTLSNIICGIFLSFSQPVRLGDAIIFKNEFGWIEEI
ncbi:MAG: mechanosensitive ion channel domain-containing protein, partial [Candidatus Omnitrophota bacterium]